MYLQMLIYMHCDLRYTQLYMNSDCMNYKGKIEKEKNIKNIFLNGCKMLLCIYIVKLCAS